MSLYVHPDSSVFLKDAEDAIYQFQNTSMANYYNGESTKILGLVELARSSKNGDELELGREDEHEKNHELPNFEFDREEITRALRNACKLFSSTSGQQQHSVDIIGSMTSKLQQQQATSNQKTTSFQDF